MTVIDYDVELTNFDMATYIDLLSMPKYLDRSDIVGYAAARNIRKLQEAAKEFITKRNEVLSEYGEIDRDKDGNDTGKRFITPQSTHYKIVMDKLQDVGNIKHRVTIFKIDYQVVLGVLSGSEILELDWMLTD